MTMVPKKITFDDLPDEIFTKIIDYAVGDLDNGEYDDLWEKYEYPEPPRWLSEADGLHWQVKVDRLWQVSRQFQRSLYDILSKRLRGQYYYVPYYKSSGFGAFEYEFRLDQYHDLICNIVHRGDKNMDIANIACEAPYMWSYIAPEDPPAVETLPRGVWPVKYGCGNRQCYVQRCCLGRWLEALERLADFMSCQTSASDEKVSLKLP